MFNLAAQEDRRCHQSSPPLIVHRSPITAVPSTFNVVEPKRLRFDGYVTELCFFFFFFVEISILQVLFQFGPYYAKTFNLVIVQVHTISLIVLSLSWSHGSDYSCLFILFFGEL